MNYGNFLLWTILLCAGIGFTVAGIAITYSYSALTFTLLALGITLIVGSLFKIGKMLSTFNPTRF